MCSIQNIFQTRSLKNIEKSYLMVKNESKTTFHMNSKELYIESNSDLFIQILLIKKKLPTFHTKIGESW